MCGIAGIINFEGLPGSEKEILKQMTDAIAHRGPDADGFFQDRHVALGHRRLSILDLSEAANQPIATSDGKVIMVFNGEIYNYASIRAELEKEFTFKTDHSDTEMIVYAYKKWGIDCLQKFNGMFALALYDNSKGKLFLVRDRLGKKPLYYVHKGSQIWFSSELHVFFKAGILRKSLSRQAVYNYLTFLTTDAPHTFFNGVKKVEAGHYLEITRDEVVPKSYWNISDHLNIKSNDSYEEALEKSKVMVEQAIAYRNIADVPVSIALSGGLDSSMNLFQSNQINTNLFCINVSYEKTSEFDESVIAKRFSDELGVRFINRQINQDDFLQLITDYLNIQQDMPLGDPNVCLMYLISTIARVEGAKVLLVGEGGDEIGGYPVYDRLKRLYKMFRNVPAGLMGMTRFLPEKFANNLDMYYAGNMISTRHIHGFSNLEKNNMWKGSELLDSYAILLKYMQEIEGDSPDDFLRKVSNVEYKLRLPELILPRVDYPSMATSIEARSPFMDHELIEYSATLPFSLRMKDGAKSILRDIARKKLPDYIMNHPKVGFGMLLTPFFHETLPQWYKKEILDADPVLKQHVEHEFLESLYMKHQATKRHGFKLWVIYALHKWMEVNGF